MKSINGKKIATIATGAAFAVAAFAGAAVTGADSLNTLSRSDFVGNGDEPQYTIVIGTGISGEGAAWDAVAAGNIASTLGNMLYSTGEAITIDSTSLSDAASQIVDASSGGSVDPSKASAEFQITTPSGGVAGASMQLVSYINDYLDNLGEKTRNTTTANLFAGQMNLVNGGVASGLPYIMSYDRSNGLLTRQVIDWTGASEEERLYLFSNPYYDTSSKQVKAFNSYMTYEAIFDDALSFCKQKSYNGTSENSPGNCQTSDYITRNGVSIKFLGDDWVVADFDIATSNSEVLKLGKKVPGTQAINTLNKGESLKTDNGYTIKVDGVTYVSTSANSNTAVFSITAPDGSTAKTEPINQASGLYKVTVGSGSNAMTFYFKVYNVIVYNTNDNTQSNAGSARFAVFTQKMELANSGSQGGKINGGENGNWRARLIVGSVAGQSNTRGITRIIVYNDNLNSDSINLAPGASQAMIDGLPQFRFTYNGVNTDNSNRDKLKFERTTATLNLNSSEYITGTFIKIHSDQANAFGKNVAGMTGVQDIYVVTNGVSITGGPNGVGFANQTPGVMYYYNSTSTYYQNTTTLFGSGDSASSEAGLNDIGNQGGRLRYSELEYFYSSTGKAVIGIYANWSGNGTVTGTGTGTSMLTFEVPEWTVDDKDSSVIDARDTTAQGKGAFYFAYDAGTGSGQFINTPLSISSTLNAYITYHSNASSGELISYVGNRNVSWSNNNLPFYSDRGSFVDTGDFSSGSVVINYNRNLAKAVFTLSKGASTSTSGNGTATVNRKIGDTIYSDSNGVKIVLKDIMTGGTGAGLTQSQVEEILSGITPSVESADVVHQLNRALVIPDTQASASGKYIVVGGEIVNSLAKDASLPLSKSGDSVISVAGNRIYVAGWTAADTQEAANSLVSYLNSLRASSSDEEMVAEEEVVAEEETYE